MEHYNKRANIYSPVFDKCNLNRDKILYNKEKSENMMDLFKNACPISGEVYMNMKDNARNPKNLKLTMDKDEKTKKNRIYVEATEFHMFCEANQIDPGEAKKKIFDAYRREIPTIDHSELHVVFPSDSFNKNVLGGTNIGTAIVNDWPMQLMLGCRHYGLKISRA